MIRRGILASDLNENNFAKEFIAPNGGISRSSFSEAVNTRGLEQLQHVFEELSQQARAALPADFQALGELAAIDGSLIDTVLSMHWADYRKKSKKAKGHFGFDINRGIPTKFRLTEGKAGERPFVSQILSAGQTGVMDRGYQSHSLFDSLQKAGKNFVCRIKASTIKGIIKENFVKPGSYVFQDSSAHLGAAKNRSELPVRVVGYQVEGAKYYVATNRFDLTAEQIAEIYKLRWNIEAIFRLVETASACLSFDRPKQMPASQFKFLAALSHVLLMAIYCRKHFNQNVSVSNIRAIRIKIQNELMAGQKADWQYHRTPCRVKAYAKS